MSSFLDDFQTSLESLPNILRRKYALLRDLDKSFEEIQRQNEIRCEQETEELKEGIRSGKIIPDATNIRFSDEIIEERKHALRIADEKVALAVQAYDLVDSHIQQLDEYLKNFEEELRREKENASGSQNPESDVKPGRGTESGRGGRKKRVKWQNHLKEGQSSGTRLSAASASAANVAGSTPAPSMDLDLPVDPNEPTYCLCNQVSYGEMVACDNPDCKIEWFHYGCVGLKEQPKGKWYCPDCIGLKNRRKTK
ncbi:PHD finger protein ING1 [Impatiens glandulifera]|uniref:PHD finger protein ING1 n=1 Tax=Impatiens glandulifera TaxID=253017 RepID=UPI001FB0F272|nr:PHD finger protein ING1 [Impatiens glandulifera]